MRAFYPIVVLASFSVTGVSEADIVQIGGGISTFTDISDDGHTAVGIMRVSTYSSFMWTRDGGMAQPEGFATNFLAASISGDGTTVVGSRRVGAAHLDAMRWTSATGLQSLGLGGPYPNSSSAFGVSRDGTVIVGSRVEGTEQDQLRSAYRWTAGGTQTLISRRHPTQDPSIGTPSSLYVSGDGNAVGIVEYVGPGANQGQSYRWTSGEGLASIGNPPGSTQSWIYDMSTDGDALLVVGVTSGGIYRWTESGGYGPMIPISWSSFQDASGDLSVIATNWPGTGGIWTEASGEVSVADFALLHGQDISGWAGMTVQVISEDGLTFGGVGFYEGESRGFIMQIPAPSTVTLLALSTFVARRRRCHCAAKR